MSDRPTFRCEGIEAVVRGDVLDVEIEYPRCEGQRVRAVQVGLCDVRAADSIRISYDFERDGWSIKQASTFSWDADDTVCDPDYQEVAFVQAWARQRPEDDDDES
jgi:hypothetical protein